MHRDNWKSYAPRKPLYVGEIEELKKNFPEGKIGVISFVKIFLPKKILFYPKKKICTKRRIIYLKR